jgi:hypothetical protein
MHGKTSPDAPAHGNVTVKPNRLFNSREARELLGGISESTFRRLTGSGRLEARKQGVFVYVSQSAIDAYIARLPKLTSDEAEQGAA